MKSSTIGLSGQVTIKVKENNGKYRKFWHKNIFGRLFEKIGINFKVPLLFGVYKDFFTDHNLIVNVGKAFVASRIGADTKDVMSHLAVGSGTTAPVATDTTLETEYTNSGMARQAAIPSVVTTNVDDDTRRFTAIWTATASVSVTELAAFNAASGGEMLGRDTFDVINLESGNQLELYYDFIITNV